MNRDFNYFFIGLTYLVACAMLVAAALSLLAGCTISFQNISTHGIAEDLVDETQSNQPNISPELSIPAL